MIPIRCCFMLLLLLLLFILRVLRKVQFILNRAQHCTSSYMPRRRIETEIDQLRLPIFPLVWITCRISKNQFNRIRFFWGAKNFRSICVCSHYTIAAAVSEAAQFSFNFKSCFCFHNRIKYLLCIVRLFRTSVSHLDRTNCTISLVITRCVVFNA